MAKDIKTLDDLTPDGQNFNKHTQFGQKLLEDSLRKFGAGRSILVDKDGNIIAGNSTTETAAAIGMEKVKVVQTDGTELVVVQRTDLSLDSPEGRELALADNMTALKGIDIDLDKVQETLGDDLAKAWGLELPDHRQAQEDDFDPDKPVDTVCKKGDIWKLGNHRLMCGDSTDPADVALLMDGKKADLVFTDPPYNVDYDANGTREKIQNDHFKSDEEAGEKLWLPAFTNLYNFAKDKCAYYLTMPQGGTHMMMMMMMMKAGWQVKHELIWRKQSLVLGRQDYNYQHEPISYGWKKNHNFVGKGKFATTSVWEFDRPTASKEHPTMKPIDLVAECMLDNSIEGFIVLDLFGGSGTTLIAAEQLNRKCYMMELDPHYCDVIIARWEKLTGNKAERISNGND